MKLRRRSWWFLLVVVLGSTVALAADRTQNTGGSCCTLIWVGILMYVYRNGGVDWALALGAAFFPILFGWFVWRNEDHGTGARWVGLITASLQLLSLLAIAAIATFGQRLLVPNTAAAIPPEERRALYEDGFIRRCSVKESAETCKCIAESARTRDEEDRRQLAFDLQQRSLAKWLDTMRITCRSGSAAPSGPSGAAAPKEKAWAPVKDDPLGLHPVSSITTDPAGANVIVNGVKRGVTPLDTQLTATEKNEVRVELDGYFPQSTTRTPNANEHFALNFTLERGATVKVITEPEGARVLVAGKEVLAKTPGVTTLVEKGAQDVVVLLEGHQALRESMSLKPGENELDVKLVKGTKVSVKSNVEGAEVNLDGAVVGKTPLDVWVAPKSKHVFIISAENRTPQTKTLKAVPKPTTLDVKLVDGERAAAQARVKKARAKYDAVNAKLEKLQAKIEKTRGDTTALERQRGPLEREMEKATDELDKADAALKAIEESRGAPKQ
ncbi:MAG: PEGA domain-containing protein [Archangium sp.]|nr:PEGA domain-containing protein [Archangium sp.]